MKIGDFIKHKRTNLTAIIINTFRSKRITFVTAMMSDNQRRCTTDLRIVKDNWEILNEAN